MPRLLLRAVAVAEKQARRQDILDAAERLFMKHPERMASVSEVASAAGVAKGTVYLYFPSKEEMLLALHERHVATFFDELARLLDGPGPLDFDTIFAVARRRIIRGPGYLELTSRCFGLMDREIPIERALEFKMAVGRMLAQSGAGLEHHFPALLPGDGVALLCNSYGMIVGLWQLMHSNKRFGSALERPEMRMFHRDYDSEVEKAVSALWAGVIARNAMEAAVPASAAPLRSARKGRNR